MNPPIFFGSKFTTHNTLVAEQLLGGVIGFEAGGSLFDADFGAEIDFQFVGRDAGAFEIRDFDYLPDPDIELFKVGVVNCCHGANICNGQWMRKGCIGGRVTFRNNY
jgi:hypothetical protein